MIIGIAFPSSLGLANINFDIKLVFVIKSVTDQPNQIDILIDRVVFGKMNKTNTRR